MQCVLLLPLTIEVRPPRCRWFMAPRKETAIGAASGLLPFRFRREPLLRPTAIGLGVVTGDLHDRKLFDLLHGCERASAIRIRRATMASGRNERQIPGIRHFDLIDCKLVEVHRSLRPLIGPARSFRISHQEFSSRNRHHGNRVEPFGGWRRCCGRPDGDGIDESYHRNDSAHASVFSPQALCHFFCSLLPLMALVVWIFTWLTR